MIAKRKSNRSATRKISRRVTKTRKTSPRKARAVGPGDIQQQESQHGGGVPFAVAFGETKSRTKVGGTTRSRAVFGPGHFGKIFPSLPACGATQAQLVALGNGMREDTSPTDNKNSRIPSGYTYLGQFIDHDLTRTRDLRITSGSMQQDHSPELDLDSLYGKGPDDPTDKRTYEGPRGKERFKLGNTSGQTFQNDLPRAADGTPLIPDARNDENLIVAQMHVLFMKFHNKVIQNLATLTPAQDTRRTGETDFARAQRIVTWHYQWMVWHDFVPRLIWQGIVRSIEQNGPQFYKITPGQRPFMPLEFSIAAFRLGHSMVRNDYSYNKNFPDTDLRTLFQFTGRGGSANPLPSIWIMDWRRFFEMGTNPAGVPVNFARKLDASIASELFDLASGHPTPRGGVPGIPAADAANADFGKLPVRNLLRGQLAGLPSGQSVRAALGVAAELNTADINSGNASVNRDTPLWYYILREAEKLGDGGVPGTPIGPGGHSLGPVGSRIMGEVFWGILHNDPSSYLAIAPLWKPFLGTSAGVFNMPDLIRFVGDINPLGD